MAHCVTCPIGLLVTHRLAFAVVVIGGSIAEVAAYAVGKYEPFLKNYVPILDHLIAIPSLALTTLSGVALVKRRYGDGPAPLAIQRTMKVLGAFGVFWAVCDKASVPQYFGVRTCLFDCNSFELSWV